MITVTVYTSPGCRPCIATKKHLDRRGITYTEVAIDSDDKIREAAIELGLSTAPIVCVSIDGDEGVLWDGYRPDRIDELAKGAA